MFTMSSHAEMILWTEVVIHVSCLGLTSIILRSDPQLSGAPEKAATHDNWLSVISLSHDVSGDKGGKRGIAVW